MVVFLNYDIKLIILCGDNCPVEQISLYDTQTFITTLNGTTGQSYMLCTEAELEYAASAWTEPEIVFDSVQSLA